MLNRNKDLSYLQAFNYLGSDKDAKKVFHFTDEEWLNRLAIKIYKRKKSNTWLTNNVDYIALEACTSAFLEVYRNKQYKHYLANGSVQYKNTGWLNRLNRLARWMKQNNIIQKEEYDKWRSEYKVDPLFSQWIKMEVLGEKTIKWENLDFDEWVIKAHEVKIVFVQNEYTGVLQGTVFDCKTEELKQRFIHMLLTLSQSNRIMLFQKAVNEYHVVLKRFIGEDTISDIVKSWLDAFQLNEITQVNVTDGVLESYHTVIDPLYEDLKRWQIDNKTKLKYNLDIESLIVKPSDFIDRYIEEYGLCLMSGMSLEVFEEFYLKLSDLFYTIVDRGDETKSKVSSWLSTLNNHLFKDYDFEDLHPFYFECKEKYNVRKAYNAWLELCLGINPICTWEGNKAFDDYETNGYYITYYANGNIGYYKFSNIKENQMEVLYNIVRKDSLTDLEIREVKWYNTKAYKRRVLNIKFQTKEGAENYIAKLFEEGDLNDRIVDSWKGYRIPLKPYIAEQVKDDIYSFNGSKTWRELFGIAESYTLLDD